MSNSLHAGPSQATMTKMERDFDPMLGYVIRQYYEGTDYAISGIESTWNSASVRTQRTHDGNLHKLVATIGGTQAQNGVPETPQDHWEIHTDFYQQDIYHHPSVFWQTVAVNQLGLNTLTIQQIQQIQDAVDATDATIAEQKRAVFSAVSLANIVYDLKRRGMDAYEVRRPVLKRVRTFSLAYAARAIVPSVDIYYLTSELQAQFGIPDYIMRLLPGYDAVNPNPKFVPTNFIWGWKLRIDDSVIVAGSNKVEETKEWVYGLISKLLYVNTTFAATVNAEIK